MPYLSSLKPGTRFQLVDMPAVTGILVKVNECRAVVRLDRPERDVDFQDAQGETRQFHSRGSQMTSWAPTTVVEPVSFPDLKENAMSKTTKNTKTGKAVRPKLPKTEPAAGGETVAPPEKPAKGKKSSPEGRKLTGLDAAAKVLAEVGTPLKCTEIVERALKQGYWQTNGQTPSATLYSAMLREINVKGKDSRFQRTDKGTFALNG